MWSRPFLDIGHSNKNIIIHLSKNEINRGDCTRQLSFISLKVLSCYDLGVNNIITHLSGNAGSVGYQQWWACLSTVANYTNNRTAIPKYYSQAPNKPESLQSGWRVYYLWPSLLLWRLQSFSLWWTVTMIAKIKSNTSSENRKYNKTVFSCTILLKPGSIWVFFSPKIFKYWKMFFF